MNTPPMLFPAAMKDMSGEWRAFMGIPENADLTEAFGTMSSYASAPADEAWVFSCVTRLSNDAQGVPLVVYVKGKKGQRTRADESNDQRAKDIQYLLDNVNNVSMTGSDLKSWHVLSMKLWGEDYWLKVKGRFGGTPQELHWLRPSEIEPQPGNGFVTAYRYMPVGSGTFTDYKPQQVIAARTPNPKNPLRGLSALSSIRYDIAVNRQATLHSAYTLANWGMPAMAWVVPKDAEVSTPDQNAIRRALRALRGPRNNGKTPIIPGGLEPKQLSLSPKDAEWLLARKASRMTICAAFGVPLVLAGDDDKNTVYGNLRDAERVYWRGTLIPMLDRHAEVLINWLLPDFGADARDKYDIKYDFSDIEALRPPLDVEMNAFDAAVDRKAITPNEYRRHFNLGPDVPWGDDPLLSTRIVTEPPIPLDKQAPEVGVNVVPIPGAVPDGPAPLAPGQPPVPPFQQLQQMKSLYREPAVKAWLADPSQPLDDVAALLGVPASDALRTGLLRRYSPGQLLDGVPSEGYPGLFGDAR